MQSNTFVYAVPTFTLHGHYISSPNQILPTCSICWAPALTRARHPHYIDELYMGTRWPPVSSVLRQVTISRGLVWFIGWSRLGVEVLRKGTAPHFRPPEAMVPCFFPQDQLCHHGAQTPSLRRDHQDPLHRDRYHSHYLEDPSQDGISRSMHCHSRSCTRGSYQRNSDAIVGSDADDDLLTLSRAHF